MRNLVVFLHTSLDGIVEGPNGPMDIDFIAYNEELENFANNTLSTADTVLWGKNTYEMMYQYWSKMLNNPEASSHEQKHAQWIENVEKIICSTTLTEVTWNNSILVKENIVDKINELKTKSGQDIVVIGSPRLTKFLLKEKLVDSLKLTISPTVVGSGLRLFEEINTDLTLVKSTQFSNGVLGVTYKVK